MKAVLLRGGTRGGKRVLLITSSIVIFADDALPRDPLRGFGKTPSSAPHKNTTGFSGVFMYFSPYYNFCSFNCSIDQRKNSTLNLFLSYSVETVNQLISHKQRGCAVCSRSVAQRCLNYFYGSVICPSHQFSVYDVL